MAHPAFTCGVGLISFSKSSGPVPRRQNRPDLRQHFLNRLPEPHGQRSLRPSFSAQDAIEHPVVEVSQPPSVWNGDVRVNESCREGHIRPIC